MNPLIPERTVQPPSHCLSLFPRPALCVVGPPAPPSSGESPIHLRTARLQGPNPFRRVRDSATLRKPLKRIESSAAMTTGTMRPTDSRQPTKSPAIFARQLSFPQKNLKSPDKSCLIPFGRLQFTKDPHQNSQRQYRQPSQPKPPAKCLAFRQVPQQTLLAEPAHQKCSAS